MFCCCRVSSSWQTPSVDILQPQLSTLTHSQTSLLDSNRGDCISRNKNFCQITCVSDPFFSRIRNRLFCQSPDRPKIRIRIRETRVKVEINLFFISSTLNTVFFGQAPPKPLLKFINGRIRTFFKPGSGSAKRMLG